MKEKLQIEEYKQVRDEIVFREKTISYLFAIALGTSVSILSAVGTFFFKLKPTELYSVSPWLAYVFLAPIAVIIPILLLLAEHRRDIHRSGTYLHVFFEDAGLGPMWETRVTEFRKKFKGESLDVLPWPFLAISSLSVVGFIWTSYLISGSDGNLKWLVSVIISLLFVWGYWKFSQASISIREKYYRHWQKIREQLHINDT